MSQGNKLSSYQQTLHGTGLHAVNQGQKSVSQGFVKEGSKTQGSLVPLKTSLRNDLHASPYTFKTEGSIQLSGDLLGQSVKRPAVLYSPDKFGQPTYDKAIHPRKNQAWRMYVQKSSDGLMFMTESIDGISWDLPVQLDALLFPAGATQLQEGFQPFYDKDGIFTVGGVSYPWSAIARDTSLAAGDATDMFAYHSLDGITWLRVAMADHATTGNPYGNEVAASLGSGSAFLGKTGKGSFSPFDATRPRTFRNAPGQWVGIQRYADAPALAGDTVLGATTMAQNDADDANWSKLGHFANWNRNSIRQTGERSFGQNTKAQLFHVQEYLGMFIGLVQLYYHEVGTATLVKSGIGLSLSRDGLHFDFMGPLYDAGLTHMLNDRTPGVNDTGMNSTAYLYNNGDGDGTEISAGSVVCDPQGMNFNGDGGRLRDARDFMRVYWTEESSGKILWGSL